jgi:F-type H+-transporting ATPase subunit gamma
LLPIEAPSADENPREYLFEPDRDAVIEDILPRYVEVKVFQAVLESIASEHGARMTAMESASKNASEMIDRLTLEMNRARQATITKELMEIVGGAEALKG